MPRNPRNYLDAEYYHVMVQGIKKEYIFAEDKYKQMYLNILINCIKDYDIKLIAYCVMGTHAHILLKSTNVLNISLCMKRVNISFARKYNKDLDRVGYVFRDRFLSEPIYEKYNLLNCIKYIHMNPVKANICTSQSEYSYSSYSDYVNKSGIITDEIFKNVFECYDEYLETIKSSECEIKFIDEILSKEDLSIVVNELLKNRHQSLHDLCMNDYQLCEIIKYIVEKYNVKKEELSEVLGITKWKLSQVLNKKEQMKS